MTKRYWWSLSNSDSGNRRRDELLQEVGRSQQEYEAGNFHRGSVADLFAELEE